MSNEAKELHAVPGRAALVDLPDDGMHLTTFGAALASAFLLSLFLPVSPLLVLMAGAWGMVAGLSRTVRPGWRRIPLTGWRLAFSPLDGMIWTASMGMVVLVAVAAMAARP